MSQTDPSIKMKKLFFLFAALLWLSSCYSTHEEDKISAPVNLIEKENIILIIADIEIAESALRQKQNFGHETDYLKESYYHAIFTEHEVTRAQYDSSMAYYRQDLEAMDEIYEEVITRLSVIESEVQHQ